MINVLLVQDWDRDVFLFKQVAGELRRLGLRVRLVHDVEPQLKHRLWSLGMETKVISFNPVKKFIPVWAETWHQVDLDKIEEYRRLEEAGISVPKWVPVYPNKKPDLTGFCDYVVVKPAIGGKGAFVRIMHRDKVEYRPITTKARGILSPALVAQEYIHTGSWPEQYRVGTIFGEPIYHFRTVAAKTRIPFSGNKFNANFFTGQSIVATGKGCTLDEKVPEEVVRLACEAHQAFPNIPLLGVDIVRDAESGKLYVLEVNSCGRTYNLIKEEAMNHQEKNGIDIHGQYGGVKAVARGIFKRLRQTKWKHFIMAKEKERELVA